MRRNALRVLAPYSRVALRGLKSEFRFFLVVVSVLFINILTISVFPYEDVEAPVLSNAPHVNGDQVLSSEKRCVNLLKSVANV